MKLSVTRFKRPWCWGRVWLTRYSTRPRSLFLQAWLGYRGVVLLLEV